MNYLAHVFVAESSPHSIIGNLLGDFVKGPLHDQYSAEITEGIRFHRKVDVFTDAHPLHLQSRNLFSRYRRRFASIIVDVCYDHFLSRHWERFSDEKRENFISSIYDILQVHQRILPKNFQQILPSMIEQDWLGSYYHLSGIEIVLNRISYRLKRGNPLLGSISEIEHHYQKLEEDFLDFFPKLIQFTT